MLTALRQNVSNPIFLIPIAVIIFVFIFTFGSWGGSDVSGNLPMAAVVNGRVISEAQFQIFYGRLFQDAQRRNRGYNVEKAKTDNLKKTAVDQLIDRELLAQAATDRGLTVTDDQLRDWIMKNVFGNEPFNTKDYERIVSSRFQTTMPRFEDQVRRDILTERMSAVLSDSLQVSQTELKDAFEARFNRVDVELVRIDPLFYKDAKADVSPEGIKQWAAANEEKIKAFYDERTNRYRVPEKVKARHILFAVAEGIPAGQKAKAKASAEAALKRAQSGEDFAALATELSQDPGSAKKGGDLGTFPRGRMVKVFEDTAFNLKEGEISSVVESDFGFHIIKLEKKFAASVRELEEVREEIAKQLSAEDAQRTQAMAIAKSALEEMKAGKDLNTLSIENLVTAADADSATPPDPYAPRVETSGWFAKNARYVPRVGVSEDLVNAAFALTKENPVHDGVIEVSRRLFMIKLKDREEPDAGKFAEEREGLKNVVLRERTNDALKTYVKGLREGADIQLNDKLLSYGS